MSLINARVSAIESEYIIHIVSFLSGTNALKMMSLELPADIKIDTEVKLQVKATSVALAKNLSGTLSYSNQIKCQIESIEEGKLLSSLILTVDTLRLESIITTASLKRLSLSQGDSVTALIKSSDLSIAEVL